MKRGLLNLVLNAIGVTLFTSGALAQDSVPEGLMMPSDPGSYNSAAQKIWREFGVRRWATAGIMLDADGRQACYDASKAIGRDPEKVIGSPRRIRRTPLFTNAPFLRLKPGDTLVKGRRWMEFHKGEDPHFTDHDYLWLKSKGKYYELAIFPLHKKLDYAPRSVMFRWNVNLASARRLHLLALSDDAVPLTLPKYRALRAALRKDFSSMLRDDSGLKIRAPRLEGTGKTKRAVFEGLAFAEYRNTVYHYRQIIGDGVFLEFRKTLVAGPRRVHRWDFDEKEAAYLQQFGNGPGPLTDQQRAAERAAYQKMQAFRRVVAPLLPPPQRRWLITD